MRSVAVRAILAFTLAVLLAASVARAQTTVVRSIDAAKSKAAFSVQHVFVERVVGTIPIGSGTVELAPDSAIPVAFSAELEPGKVNTGDRDRDASLASSDFFDAQAYPAWTFTSTKITPQDATTFVVDGTLTIRGTPQPEHLVVTVRGSAAHPVYHAVAHIDRHGFHMPVTRLDPVIGQIADVTLDVVLK